MGFFKSSSFLNVIPAFFPSFVVLIINMEMSEVQHKGGPEAGRFYIEENGKIAALMEYSIDGNTLIIEHTVVKPEFEGKGYGRRLVDHAAGYAREHKYKVDPVCVYANKVMHKTEEYRDILV
jgi:predicted GNAT family acetyltransferase